VKSYSEALSWLYSTQLFGIKPGLEPVLRMVRALAIPIDPRGDEGKPVMRVHVAGTNGKGSTCAMLASICRAAGLRTGLYTSPHLVSFRERIQIDGDWIPEDAVLRGLNTLRNTVEKWDPHPTFFELVTVLALWWFQQSGVSVVVLETGMGGLLDATNVVTPSVSVLTPIGLDHQKQLGENVREIALQKAGILKKGVPAVSAPQASDVRTVFSQAAREKEVRLRWVCEPWRKGSVGLRGEVQQWNAALAVAAVQLLPRSFPDATIAAGLAGVHWPGRFHRLEQTLVLDGAHNPHAAAELIRTWRGEFGALRAEVVFGAAEDKDAAGMLRILAPLMDSLTVVPIRGRTTMPPDILEKLARECAPGLQVYREESLAAVLARKPTGMRLVTGSLFLVGEALAVLQGLAQERSLQ
jgi:dihydrofolate synthase/folylpolyglutamate synthase